MAASTEGRSDALAEGRRIYLGNLHYVLKPYDIEEVLVANGFGEFENIHISVDPVSARNPGYCFVDFVDLATAERALSSLNATIRGRQLKVGPCEPKKKRNGEERHAFQRWGDWRTPSSDDGAAPTTSTTTTGRPQGQGQGQGQGQSQGHSHSHSHSKEQGPRAALAHFDEMVDNYQGRRLYVGGLTKMIDQGQNSEEIREIFEGFNPVAIGKRITPHESVRETPGNHHYCFVDFETKEEAEAAIGALNATPYKGGVLKVSMAKGIPDKLINNRADARPARREQDGRSTWRASNSRPENAPGSNRAMASNDWRRKVD